MSSFDNTVEARALDQEDPKITLHAMDMKGNVIRTLSADEWMPAGAFTRQLEANAWPAGSYFVKLLGTKFTQARKMVLVR